MHLQNVKCKRPSNLKNAIKKKNLHFFLTFRRQKPTILTWRAETQRPMASLVATSKVT